MVTRIGIDSPTHDVLSVDGAEFRFGCHGGLPVEWDGDDRGGLLLSGAGPPPIHRQQAWSGGSAERLAGRMASNRGA
jgi:hypothetical protein